MHNENLELARRLAVMTQHSLENNPQKTFYGIPTPDLDTAIDNTFNDLASNIESSRPENIHPETFVGYLRMVVGVVLRDRSIDIMQPLETEEQFQGFWNQITNNFREDNNE